MQGAAGTPRFSVASGARRVPHDSGDQRVSGTPESLVALGSSRRDPGAPGAPGPRLSSGPRAPVAPVATGVSGAP